MTGPAAAVIDPARAAALLELSDERDRWLARLLGAERRAYDQGRKDGYREGRADEGSERDAAWNAAATAVVRVARNGGDGEGERRRWRVRDDRDRTRVTFGRPHPADRPADRPVRRSGMVWLGGPSVHYHRCSDACQSYLPGACSPAQAAEILATLPGSYGDEIAALRRSGLRAAGGDA